MKKIIMIFILAFSFPHMVYAQRGCCSHHGGVAGCGSNGKQICNDGTYSPSCTCTPQINYVYGCTDSDAYNYNKNANKDDGSCKYLKYVISEEEILYSTETITGDEDGIKQKGKNGKKLIKTEQIINKNGTILSSKIVEEKVIISPVTEILIKKEITNDVPITNNLEQETTTISTSKDTQLDILDTSESNSDNTFLDTIFPLTIVGAFIFFIFHKRK